MRLLTFGLVAMLALTGCAGHAFGTPGATGYQWYGSMLNGAARLSSTPGTFVSARCPSIVRDGSWWSPTCTEVTVQAEPPGSQAYSYVYKIKIRSGFGIPYGEAASIVYVVGDHEECLRQSAAHNVRSDGQVNEGNLRLSADPTERCAGPVWIR